MENVLKEFLESYGTWNNKGNILNVRISVKDFKNNSCFNIF